ncbi:MAG: SMI1/KNR4 family protein [Sedimentisphaerales bacterium]|nr:SMI1/KNR4 family protein [Sedimentisphaerales bacterium]
MSIKMKKTGKRAEKDELQNFEEQTGHPLPEDYRIFLMKHNGAVPETNEFRLQNAPPNGCGVNEFLSIADIITLKAKLQDRFVLEAWPIAYAECGNYVCLVFGEKEGIYFWDHELEVEEGKEPSWENMFLLAITFTDFFEGLCRLDVNSIDIKPGQVKEVWVDPDFKPEF